MDLQNNFGQPDNNSQNEDPAVVSGNGKKVLIVEDEKMLADALELKLSHAGFQVSKAENGQVGLDVAKTFSPDIILLDLMMPVMDGKTMLHQLRQIESFKTTPVIVLTNAGDIDNIRETQLYYNVDSFLIKSNVSAAEIVKHVQDLT